MDLSQRIPSIARRSPFWWWACAAWFVLLYILSSYSKGPAGVPVFMISDKIAHATYFTAGSAALYWALALKPKSIFASKSLLALACCIVAAALVGWFDEWHQSFTPGRSANDLGDWIADIIGGILGFVLGKLGLPLLARVVGEKSSTA